jgi:arabinose-5-phosphate isomerase
VDYIAKAQRVFDTEISELQRLQRRLGAPFSQAVETILHSVERKGKVVVMGVGKSGHIGEKIAATLTSTGSPAVVLNSLNALHGDLGVVADGDVVLALSYSGETEELINVLPALSRFDVKIIAITGNAQSFLAKNCHVHLDVNVEQEACPLNLAPTSSTTAMLVLGDALAMVLLEARGFNKEDFARYHPGGRLGRTLLLKVNQIMRNGDQMAVVPPGMNVRDVLHEMTKRRAGAAVVTGADGKLLGIFTHGDFARQFQRNPDLGGRPVEEFITRNPVTIHGDRLAAEVLHVLETHRIDDLVVVDEQNIPIGIVDSQDLARFKLL